MSRVKRFFSGAITLLTILGAASFTAVAHPGSGIVVDAQGNVFFQDSAARTIWKIDPQGNLTAHSDKLGGHWMALDAQGKFARSDLKLVERIAPALIVADGGAPITVNADGNLYYGLDVSRTGQVSVGMMRIFPDGRQELFAPNLAKSIENLGITGLASGPDGTLYAACLTGVWKVKTDGTFTTLTNPVVMKDCDRDAPTVFLRGLDVDAHGTVYAAASGCRGVVKITTNGKVETVLKAERPWSPTGVAVQGDDVYVLEYTNANGHVSEDWLPRVRKLGRDGKVTTLATISKEQQQTQPNRLILPSANPSQAASPAQDANPLSTELRQLYTIIKNNLAKMAEKMPEEHYGFRATPEVRSFGQLIVHVAEAQTRNCTMVNGERKDINLAAKTSKADLVAALKESFAVCDVAFNALTDAKASEMIPMGQRQRSKFGLLSGLVSHSNEEYGYLAVYLRLKGIVPPSSEGR